MEFNRDAENRKLMDFYNRKAIMEILGQARDEKSHSAFLKWVLDCEDITTKTADTPIMWLLQLLCHRQSTATGYTQSPIFDELERQILTRSLQFRDVTIENEKPVRDITNNNYFKNNFPNVNEQCEDKLDLHIKLHLDNVNHNGQNISELEIIIENKVLSSEEGAKTIKKFINGTNGASYDDKKQTERYYIACSYNCPKDKLQLYVYLTAQNQDCSDKHFIKISYQDILDYILSPLLQSDDLTDRARFILEEYIDGLSIPTADTKENKRIVMATSKKEERLLSKFIEKNRDLIIEVLKACVKKGKKQSLSPDDELAIDFGKTIKSVLYAALSRKGDCSSLFDDLFDGNVDHLYIMPDFSITKTDSDFGFEFAKQFALHNEANVTTIQELETALNDQIGLNTHAIYYSSNQNQKQCRELIGYPITLYITTGTWQRTGNGLLTKLIQALSNHRLEYFNCTILD